MNNDEDIFGIDPYEPSKWQIFKGKIKCIFGRHFPSFIYNSNPEAINYCKRGCGYIFDWGAANENDAIDEDLAKEISQRLKEYLYFDRTTIWLTGSNIEHLDEVVENGK